MKTEKTKADKMRRTRSLMALAAVLAALCALAGEFGDRVARAQSGAAGVRVAFVSDRDGNNEIYAMNADGSNQTRLTDNMSANGASLTTEVTVNGAVAPGEEVVVTATAGTTGPTTYPTLKAAFDAINAGTHQGAITVGIVSDTTEGTTPATLNGSGAGSASYTSVLVRPVSDGISVSGNPAGGFGVIQLNGASNVTIDGDNPDTPGTNRNLTVRNTATNTTTFTSVVRIALAPLGATTANNDTIKNLNVVGSATGRNVSGASSGAGSENTTYGILANAGGSTGLTTEPAAITSVTTTISGSATAANLLIQNNSVSTAGRAIAVQGSGSATTVFPGLMIKDNLIGNPTAGAVDQVYASDIVVSGTADGVISGNTCYLEGFIANVVSVANQAISAGVLSANTTVTIEKNKVARVHNNAPDTWPAIGINLGGGNNHVVQNNFVSDIRNSQVAGNGGGGATFGAYGIRAASGTGHKVYHNSVNLFGTIPGAISTDLTAAFIIVTTGQTGMDVRNNIFSNQLTGGNPTATNTRHAVIYLPSGATSAMNLTLNNNAYLQGPSVTGALSLLAKVGLTQGTGQFFAADFDAGATTPAPNLRSYTSTLSGAGTNDNASTAVVISPPFTSDTDLHIPDGTISPLESGGAAVGLTSDIDGQTRPGPPGSVKGGGTAPDMGADEFDGVNGPFPTPTPTQHQLSVGKTGAGGGTVTSSPAGIDCGPNCSAMFDGGTSVTLSATSDSNSTFNGWTGDGTDNGDGTRTVTMSQARSVTATFNANQTVTFTSTAPSTAASADTYTPAAQGGGSGQPVTFGASGACSYSGGTVTMTSIGTCTVTADQAGDTGYNAAPQATQVFSVGQGTPNFTFSLASLPAKTYEDAPFSVVSYASTNSTGAITFALGAGSVGCSVTSAGQVTITGAATGTSKCIIKASLAADTNYNSAGPVSQSFNISRATPSFSGLSGPTITYGGGPTSLGGTIAAGPLIPTGSVSITVNGVTQTAAISPATGAFSSGFSTQAFNANTSGYTITYSYAQTTDFNGATNNSNALTVNRATGTVSINNIPGTAVYGYGFTPTFTTNSNGATSASSLTPGTCMVGSGEVSFVGVGTCQLQASVAVGTNHTAATGAVQSFTINRRATTITYTGATSGQYSDCTPVSAILTDAGSNTPIVGASVTLTIGTQSTTAVTGSNGEASGSIQLDQPPGNVSAGASFAGSPIYLGSSTPAIPFTIQAENAQPLPGSAINTSSNFFWATGSSSSTATLTLSATIQDVSDSCRGDIRKARITFAIRNADGSTTPITGAMNLPVGLVNANDLSVGTATAIVHYNIGSANAASLDVAVLVGGSYFRNNPIDDTVVTVAKPLTSSFIVGGGSLANDMSSGFLAAAADINLQNQPAYPTVFSFNVKYNNSGTNPQGGADITVRSYNKPNGMIDKDGSGNPVLHVYKIKSSAIAALGVTPGNPAEASFSSKANIVDITDPLAPISVDGGATLQITMTDYSTTTPDTIGITVQNKAGGLWYSSLWVVNKTRERSLVSGTISVR